MLRLGTLNESTIGEATGVSSVVAATNTRGIRQFVWYAGLYSGSAAFLKLVGFSLFLWFAAVMPVVG